MRQKEKIRKKKMIITRASIMGGVFSLLLFGTGHYVYMVMDGHTEYPITGLGIFLAILVIIISWAAW